VERFLKGRIASVTGVPIHNKIYLGGKNRTTTLNWLFSLFSGKF
jgi:hypothetical protein